MLHYATLYIKHYTPLYIEEGVGKSVKRQKGMQALGLQQQQHYTTLTHVPLIFINAPTQPESMKQVWLSLRLVFEQLKCVKVQKSII